MINETKEAAEITLVEMLEEQGITDLKKGEIEDFGLQGGETNTQIAQMVTDYMNELATDKAEWNAFLSDPHTVDPINY